MDTSDFDIQEMVSKLAKWRQERDDCKATMDEIVEQAKGSDAFIYARNSYDGYQVKISSIEEKIRGWAVEDYKATGNKKPHSALQIRVTKAINYAADKAIEWCEKNLPVAIKRTVDAKLFEKTVMSIDTLPDFANVTEEPKATIATDLSEYLLESKPEKSDEELPF